MSTSRDDMIRRALEGLDEDAKGELCRHLERRGYGRAEQIAELDRLLGLCAMEETPVGVVFEPAPDSPIPRRPPYLVRTMGGGRRADHGILEAHMPGIPDDPPSQTLINNYGFEAPDGLVLRIREDAVQDFSLFNVEWSYGVAPRGGVGSLRVHDPLASIERMANMEARLSVAVDMDEEAREHLNDMIMDARREIAGHFRANPGEVEEVVADDGSRRLRIYVPLIYVLNPMISGSLSPEVEEVALEMMVAHLGITPEALGRQWTWRTLPAPENGCWVQLDPRRDVRWLNLEAPP